MQRFQRLLVLSAALGLASFADAGGCKHCGSRTGGGTPEGNAPYWCDSFANLSPWPYDNYLIDGPRNWSWIFPDGGFTAYLGTPGSGTPTGSDYSHINWVSPPTTNAQLVLDKLRSLGIPSVPQETIYLGKNPGAVDKAKLPLPKSWIKDEEPKEIEKEKAKDKDKDKDQDKDN